jgi:hypothetical protein
VIDFMARVGRAIWAIMPNKTCEGLKMDEIIDGILGLLLVGVIPIAFFSLLIGVRVLGKHYAKNRANHDRLD